MESEYIIPRESSIISFTPTAMNSGSGDWWIYAEDQNNYYYYIGDETTPYIFISKKQSSKYTEFDSRNYMTWNLDNVTLQLIKRNE